MRLRSGFRKKKANVAIDLLFAIVAICLFGMVSIMAYKAFDEMNTDMQLDDSLTNLTKSEIGDLHSRYPSTMDSIFMIAFGLLWIMLLAAAFLIDAKPMFFGVMFVIILFAVIAMMFLNNGLAEFMDDDEISGFQSSFPMSYWIMTHLLSISIIIGLSTLTVMYAKTRLS